MLGFDYMTKKKEKIRVAELFAGVGGFRLGLTRNGKGDDYEIVWSNQWEPATKKQHASEVYVSRFGSAGHSNEDIAKVEVGDIPTHDLLVGGFPCQDYSVARTLSQAAGLKGKKGVLWWEIHRILKEKKEEGEAPGYLMLENVDRLLKSPANQRGRDFAIMLASLNNLGYAVEWRIINAADYGMPQRRRRIFMLGFKKGTPLYSELEKAADKSEWVTRHGIVAKSFPVEKDAGFRTFELEEDLVVLTKMFGKSSNKSAFLSAGISINRKVITSAVVPKFDGKGVFLGEILQEEKDVPEEFFIKKADLPRWKYLKGKKNEPRKGKGGFKFTYNEGSMIFPDALDKPSRTIITAEGGTTPSRFKHVIRAPSGRLRRLTPIELERLCMFPTGHTEGQADSRRAFFMGNALVVGVIERLGKELAKRV